ncbi:MAG TPA: glycoside hydrolase 43 family protein [Tepidisphaeraceae bacterium]|nr:glycoside hydrolase 43 family protein [Tepidisphaeraceae bacterium]
MSIIVPPGHSHLPSRRESRRDDGRASGTSDAGDAIGGYPWTPDRGDGTYRNPILFADYSDPDVVRVGDDFFLTASSFNCTPGLPILHSRDLVNWKIVNHAIRQVPDARYERVQHGCGVWAPSIRHHDGRFWIFFPTPDEGIYVTTADDPRERWSEPRMVVAGNGLIDPCPLWDDDGKAYLVFAYAHSRSGLKHQLRVCPMASDASRLLGDGQVVFRDEARHPTMEGPKFHKRDGWYYILAPAGGVATGWQVALRSRQVYGPYEPRIVLERGATSVNGPHQGALIDSPDGREWWFVHFQEMLPYGRIVHLQPATWRDGWPMIGIDQDGNGIGEPVAQHRKPMNSAGPPPCVPQSSDEFDSPQLGLQWQWHANHKPAWYSLDARPGWLRLNAQPLPAPDRSLPEYPALLLQKFPAMRFATETRVELHADSLAVRAGLAVVGLSCASLSTRREGQLQQVVLQINGENVAAADVSLGAVTLRIHVSDGGACRFEFTETGSVAQAIGDTFKATEGKWIGAKIGVFCASDSDVATDAHADFDYVRLSRAD